MKDFLSKISQYEKKDRLYFLVIAVLYLSTRLIFLGPDIANTDAYRWHHRSQNFLEALKKGDFKSTYQHYQPGVTLMWLNSFVKQASFTVQYHLLNEAEPKTLENSEFFPFIHGVSKAVIILALFGLLMTQMHLVSKLFERKIAMYFGLFISLEPYLIGIDRWFHLTSLESYFSFTSLLFILVWYKQGKRKYLILSSTFLALAILSKVTALVSLPVIIFVIFKRSRKEIIFFGAYLALFIFMFFPALVTNPLYVFQELYNAIMKAAFGGNPGGLYKGITKLLFYDITLFLKLSPITLTLFILSVATYRRSIKSFSAKMVFLHILFYYFFLTFSQKKIDRYVISMFPSIILIAVLYFDILKNKARNIVYALLGFHFLVILYFYYPVFSSYNSLIFGGTATAIKLGVYDNSGEYFADAARYLNEKGRDINVYVPEGTSSFVYYYWGNMVYEMSEKTDFVVISLDTTRKTAYSYGCTSLEKSFGTREKEVVFVYKCR